MIEILKLVIGKLKAEKLNELNFDNFGDNLLSAVVLSRVNDISNNKIKKIDFGKLTVDAQKLLFKKMADNNFEDFDLNLNLSKVKIEVFKSASIRKWRKFVFEKIPNDIEEAKKSVAIFKKCKDILKLMPVNILSLFDTRKQCDKYDSYYTFFSFLMIALIVGLQNKF